MANSELNFISLERLCFPSKLYHLRRIQPSEPQKDLSKERQCEFKYWSINLILAYKIYTSEILKRKKGPE